jgi:hypothetical protein
VNLYFVISEYLDDSLFGEAPEPYRLWGYISARNRSQAKYLCWKESGDFSYDMRDMPKFQIRILEHDTIYAQGLIEHEEVISQLDEEHDELWNSL